MVRGCGLYHVLPHQCLRAGGVGVWFVSCATYPTSVQGMRYRGGSRTVGAVEEEEEAWDVGILVTGLAGEVADVTTMGRGGGGPQELW